MKFGTYVGKSLPILTWEKLFRLGSGLETILIELCFPFVLLRLDVFQQVEKPTVYSKPPSNRPRVIIRRFYFMSEIHSESLTFPGKGRPQLEKFMSVVLYVCRIRTRTLATENVYP